MKIEKILIATDFSDAAGVAFKNALFLAQSHNAQLILLHVVDQIHGPTNYEILAVTPDDLAKRMEKEAHLSLQAMVERAKDSVTVVEMVREGRTWDVICKTATEVGADIIVMASQGRTGLAHALIGSVAESVVRHAECPVLVVRGPN